MTANHKNAARIFEAVSHPARLQVLTELSERDLMVFELVQLTGLQQSPLSQHLKRLRDLRLVTSRKKGKNIQYALTPGIAEKIVLFTLRNFST